MCDGKDKVKEVAEERFDVLISLNITKHNQADRERFFQTDVQYYKLDYASMVGIEQLMLGVLNQLGEAGIEAAKANGLAKGSLLEALGVVGQNES